MENQIKPGDQHWFSNVVSPINHSINPVDWEAETDVIVVGAGGAGISAALEASEHAKKVILLDRFHEGGATAASGGVFYAGGGTSIQEEAGEEDTPENMYNYLKMEVQDVVKDSTLRKFCDDSRANTDWLIKHNVKFQGSVYKQKTSYPPPGYFLYHSDNSLVPEYIKNAKPAARGHRGYVESKLATGHGVTIFNPLRDSALRNGVIIQIQSEVVGLINNDNNEVIGVQVYKFQSEQIAKKHLKYSTRATALHLYVTPLANYYRRLARNLEENGRDLKFIKARKGVVLTCGGFVFNRPMLEHYAPKYSAGYPLGTTGDDGSGIRLGQSVQGAVDRMDLGSAWRNINPPVSWSRGVIVNKEGQRYTNEMVYGANLGKAMCEDNEGKGYVILDKKLWKESWKQIMPGKVLAFQRNPALLGMLFGSKKAKTLEELAKKANMEPSILIDQVQRYNSDISEGSEDQYGKAQKDCVPIEEGPFYAIDISVDSPYVPCPVITLGGLVINEETGNVKNNDGKDIKGLYAGGRTAIGICCNIYVSGLSIADGIFSGRRAGLNISGN
ncbi:MAG: FAD-binding protein [SAR86 cluster bacterium]|nr:FAD-binding protein [SAR86 cluster bacterium]